MSPINISRNFTNKGGLVEGPHIGGYFPNPKTEQITKLFNIKVRFMVNIPSMVNGPKNPHPWFIPKIKIYNFIKIFFKILNYLT